MHGSCEGPSLSTRRPCERRDPYAAAVVVETRWNDQRAKYCSPWLWVPAFAGTTGIVGSPSLRGAKRRSNPFFLLRGADGLLRCARNDVDGHGISISRRDAPELCFRFSPQQIRGRREGRVLAGTRGLVCNKRKENAHEHTGISRGIRPSLRNGLTAYAVLSSETNSFCLRRRRIDGSHRPVELCKPPPT